MTANETQMILMLCGVSDATPTSETVTALAPINLQTRMVFLMSLRVACLANLQALSGNGVELLTKDGCGRTPCEALESYDPDTRSWKTRGPYSHLKAAELSEESLGALPISGMMCNGTLYPLPRLVQATGGNGSGYLLPTPIARDWKDSPGMAKQAGARKRTDTLPRAIYDRENSPPRSGIINPKLSLWLMGFPENWLEIN